MKILLVNKFHYIKGGSETYYFGLAALLRQKGHEVIFFSMQDEQNFPCDQKNYFVGHVDFNAHMSLARQVKAGLKMLYSFEAGKKFKKLLEDEKPDLIHLNIFQSQLTGSIVDVAYKMGIPMVYTAHDLKSICPNYQMLNRGGVCEKCLHGRYFNCAREKCMKDSGLKSILASLETEVYRWRKTYKKIDYVITPSAFYKGKMEESGVFDCPVEHIPNFLPENTVYSKKPSVGEYFLYFGRLSREKGAATLIRAYAGMKTRRKLCIVGTGPLEEEFRELIHELNMEENIRMLGFRSGVDLTSIVRNAFCVILPSEWYENGPYSIMEAMAAGRPAIVSGYGGLPELVEEGKNGYICPPCDVSGLRGKMELMDSLPEEELLNMSANSSAMAERMFGREGYYAALMRCYVTIQRTKVSGNRFAVDQ